MSKAKTTILLVLIFILGTLLGGVAKYYNVLWVADRNINEYLDFFEPKEINDNYGGSTPEETLDLYISALKKGDLDLASKYFVVDQWDKRLKFLKEVDLDSYIKELESIDRDNWKVQILSNDQTGIKYNAYRFKERTIKTLNQKGLVDEILSIGKFSAAIVFKKINNIWKIQLL